MEIYNNIKHLKSVVVNSVHDSIVIDIHPDEINEIQNVIKEVQKNLVKLLETKYGIEFNVPLLLEAKIGDNWLDTKDVA